VNTLHKGDDDDDDDDDNNNNNNNNNNGNNDKNKVFKMVFSRRTFLHGVSYKNGTHFFTT
jgi:hypothetical protein